MTDFLKVKTYSISPMGFNLGSMKMVAFSRLSFRKEKTIDEKCNIGNINTL